ncbi:hypothetical protein DID96_02235 [Burkholderia sp. Bp8963]|nr:hypothetical protein DID96_02235 [Burkholderia sp. Bp8963]
MVASSHGGRRRRGLHARARRPVYSAGRRNAHGRRFATSQHLKRLDARRIQCPNAYAHMTRVLRLEGFRLGSLTG